MTDGHQNLPDLKLDRSSLYREEIFTDLKSGSIKQLIPVKPNGSPDKSRKTVFMGTTHILTDHGPLPVQGIIKAKDLQQALKQFPEAMKSAMVQMIEEAKQMQQENESQIISPGEDSRIIVPGR